MFSGNAYLNGPLISEGEVTFDGYEQIIDNVMDISGKTIFSRGAIKFSTNSSIINLGSVAPEITWEGTVEFNTGSEVSLDSIKINGGDLGGSDDLLINHSLEWIGRVSNSSNLGTYQAGTSVTIAKEAQFILASSSNNNVYCQIDNYGTTIWNGGSLTFYDGVDFDNYGVFLDTMKYAYIWKLQSDGSTFNNFGTYIKSGDKNYIDLPFVNKPEGFLKGTGGMQLSGGFTNEGTVSPGDPIGSLTFAGDYSATASSILAIELSGLTAGDEYDQLVIYGTASLGGTLDIKMHDDYVPEVGNEFQIITFTSANGSFDTFRGLDTGKGVAFEVTQSETGVKLVAIAATPNTPPTALNLISPEDEIDLETLETIDFLWQASFDVEGDSLFYDLNISGDSFDATITHLADTSFTFISQNSLDYNTSYDWTVSVTDGISDVASPDVFSFTTPLPNDIGDQDFEVPEKFNLAQNYPNPFNPVTTIGYDLPENSHVVLKIFDVTGREIQTLVNGSKPAGRHQVEFNSALLASGIYLYRIEAGNEFQVKRMLLIK